MIKFETNENKQDPYILPKLLNENDVMEFLGFKDNNDFYDIKTSKKLDTLKTYRLYLDNPRFIKIEEKLNLKSKDTLIIKLQTNPNCNCKTFTKDVLVMNCPYYSFGAYIAKEPRNLDELPLTLSQKIKNHLLNRVGKKFYKNIYFKKGQIIDSIPYKKYSQKSKMKTRFHYYLCFAYTNIKKGIGEYTSNIEIDENGNIIKEIDFPIDNRLINNIVSLKEIKDIAIKEKFYIEENTKIEMAYDSDKNLLIWIFKNKEYKPNGVYIEKELIYNAHNGNYIDLKINTGQWVE